MARKATGGKPGRPFHPELLTPAEQRVLEGVREGLHNAEIGVRLGITPDGVKFHVSNMLTKLNLSSREELAHWQAPRESALRRVWLAIPLAAKWAVGGVAAVAVAGGITALFLVGDSSDSSPDYPDGLVSVSSAGEPGNQDSFDATISGDGRYVVFSSAATNLVANDTNQFPDVFLRDRLKGTTTRISMGLHGEQANDASQHPVISADGRFIAFESRATNLVDIAPNTDERALAALQSPNRVVVAPSNQAVWNIVARNNIYRYDVVQRRTELVSIADDGSAADLGSTGASISGDGRFVAFDSIATNLVVGDANQAAGGLATDQLFSGLGGEGVFVRDMTAIETTRVSVSNDGAEANGSSSGAATSGDGRVVAFITSATNLGTNEAAPRMLMRRDLSLGKTTELLPSSLLNGNVLAVGRPVVSRDGSKIVAISYSLASALSPAPGNDPNAAVAALWTFTRGGSHFAQLDTLISSPVDVLVSLSGDGSFAALPRHNDIGGGETSFKLSVFSTQTDATEDVVPAVVLDAGTLAFAPTLSDDGRWLTLLGRVGNHVQVIAQRR